MLVIVNTTKAQRGALHKVWKKNGAGSFEMFLCTIYHSEDGTVHAPLNECWYNVKPCGTVTLEAT